MAGTSGRKRTVESQIGDYIANLFETPFYFRRICEVCPHTPPNPRHTVWNSKFIFEFANHGSIPKSIKKEYRQSNPLGIGPSRDKAQKKTQKTAPLPRFRG